jgi:Ca2+-binding RTX toxin-like protein
MEEANADGSHAFFETEERLTIDDVDNAKDVYAWAGGASELVSIGSSDIEVELERTSADGALTHFWTKEPLAAADGDADGDIYLSTLDTQVAAGQAPPPRPLETPRRTCLGKAATIAGTSGAETLRGTARRDVIAALGGADRVFGRGGNDLICAGSGKDLVRAGAGNDEATGGAGADRLYGDGGRDRLFGQGGRDRVFGGGGNRDLMSGGGSTDSCRDSGPSRRSGCE